MNETVGLQVTLMGPPAPIALGRIVRAAAEMLEREMSAVFEESLDGECNAWGEPHYETARQACRIMLLCRNLAEEIKRYENDNRLGEDGDGDGNS